MRRCRRCFNPRPRAGGDLDLRDGIEGAGCVSIRAPVRGATVKNDDSYFAVTWVSIRAPVRGATRRRHSRPARSVSRRGFNPRPRAGGDRVHRGRDLLGVALVSIRAPVRGATR